MKNLNLIRKLAWKFTKRTGLNYQELFSEATVAYCEAILDYEPDKNCKLTTFAYTCMNNHLINFSKKEQRRQERVKQESEWPDHIYGGQEEEVSFFDLIEDWPDDAKYVAEMILESPERYLGQTPNFKRQHFSTIRRQGRVRKDLKTKGWDGFRIELAILDVQNQLQKI